MIIIFNLNKLAKQLSENKLRETHKMFYLLVPLIVLVASSTTSMMNPWAPPSSILWMVNTVLEALILSGGMLWMWLINRQGDQKNFLERFICLSFPIQVYLQIAIFALQLGLRGILLPLSEVNGALGSPALSVALFNLILVVHFLLLARWMKKTSHRLV